MSASNGRIKTRIVLIDALDRGVFVDEIAHVVIGPVRFALSALLKHTTLYSNPQPRASHVFLLMLPGRMAE